MFYTLNSNKYNYYNITILKIDIYINIIYRYMHKVIYICVYICIYHTIFLILNHFNNLPSKKDKITHI